jgi:RNA polymerase sigma-70 factor (ECF subfamily)
MSAFGISERDQLVAGDPAAWHSFVQEHLPVVRRAAERTVGSAPIDPDDIAQEVFVRLCARDYLLLKRFDPERAPIVTFLVLITRGMALDHLRRRPRATLPLEQAPEPAALETPTPTTPPLLLHLLTQRQRTILTFLYEQDRSVDEVAQILGISPQTVRSTRHNAIRILREHGPAPADSRKSPIGLDVSDASTRTDIGRQDDARS